MKELEKEYQELVAKLEGLTAEHNKLWAREEQKKEERDRLEKELEKEGINTKDLPGEKARIEKELQEEHAKIKEQVDQFERSLKQEEGEEECLDLV